MRVASLPARLRRLARSLSPKRILSAITVCRDLAAIATMLGVMSKQGLPQWVNYVPLVGLVTIYVPRKPTEKELRILFDQQGIVQKWLLLDTPAT